MGRTNLRIFLVVASVCFFVLADQVTDILNGVSHNLAGNESVIEHNTSATHESQNSTKATTKSCVSMLTVAVPLTFFFIF
ncbi:hypothetical protein RB195_000235 [Necator americanus]|uniref:Uncharacterized protein n=1 Tax=Necator americanus TaxID=51031 RepID=A0ABR1D9U0_NECAM